MASVVEQAAAHYRRRKALVLAADRAALRLWEGLDPHSLRSTWAVASRALLAVITQAQQLAASAASPYVSGVLTEQGADPAPAVNAAALAGVASDGRDLATLLDQPLITTLTAIGRGVSLSTALMAGQTSVRMIAGTQVADAGRVADGVAITGSRHGGYVRMLSPPSCSRCAVLAGRWYAWNAGFDRHPRCDCVSIPAAENIAGDLVTSPKAYFASLSPADQNRIFTNAGAQAIRDGADIGSVVNARRGMTTAAFGDRQGAITTEGTTARGVFGGYVRQPDGTLRRRSDDELEKRGGRYRVAKDIRLMPEQIYRDAAGDRDKAIELLKKFGYLL
jgi:hypothetical protein